METVYKSFENVRDFEELYMLWRYNRDLCMQLEPEISKAMRILNFIPELDTTPEKYAKRNGMYLLQKVEKLSKEDRAKNLEQNIKRFTAEESRC
jgi:hypothetical protein